MAEKQSGLNTANTIIGVIGGILAVAAMIGLVGFKPADNETATKELRARVDTHESRITHLEDDVPYIRQDVKDLKAQSAENNKLLHEILEKGK